MGSSRPDTDVVTLKAMRFHARIGMLPHEHEIGLRRTNSGQLVVRGEWHKLDGNMRDHGLIGLEAVAQSIEVDASLWVRRTGERPSAKDIVDYRRVYDLVAEVVTQGHTTFLEEVGERIADRALQLPLVERVRIAVRKPNVALPGPLAYAEVALERERV